MKKSYRFISNNSGGRFAQQRANVERLNSRIRELEEKLDWAHNFPPKEKDVLEAQLAAAQSDKVEAMQVTHIT